MSQYEKTLRELTGTSLPDTISICYQELCEVCENRIIATADNPDGASHGIADVLISGGVALATTDTVCGLIASSHEGVSRIVSLKQRPPTMPVALLVAQDHPVIKWLIAESLLEGWMRELIPGPLTVVLPKDIVEPMLPDDVIHLGYQNYGLRSPYYPPLWSVFEKTGGVLHATSANLHWQKSPDSIATVAREIASGVDVILDGGNCPYGLHSTVAVLGSDGWQVSRKIDRLPLLDVIWEPIARDAGDKTGIPADETPSKSDTNERIFWPEPPLGKLKKAKKITYRNTSNLTSSQRDMLSALAAWSRVDIP